ncbi:MAG: protein translocase subunit SecF [Candidatus Methanomethylophilaceae archaeon]|nr:protein translocase subunit SecF [Candidatus Methanomethylophilaceae archaeon]
MNDSKKSFLSSLKNGERMFPFVEKRKIFFWITCAFFALGILCMVIRGFAWDTDFIGGTAMEIHIGKTVDPAVVSEITEITEEIIGKKVSSVRKTGDRGDDVLIKCTEIPTEVRDEVFEALKDRYGLTDADRLSVSSVGGSISADFRRSAVLSVCIAVALMLGYITFRFSFLSGIAAILCLIHDLFAVLFCYSLFGLPVNSNIIAALLTILGYSINATIIVFDRVRENRKLEPGDPFPEHVNRGVNQTLMRSINTTITTLLTIVMIYLFGVTSIREFILPLIVGILAGLYSSVCLAGNLWNLLSKNGTRLRVKEPEKAKSKK